MDSPYGMLGPTQWAPGAFYTKFDDKVGSYGEGASGQKVQLCGHCQDAGHLVKAVGSVFCASLYLQRQGCPFPLAVGWTFWVYHLPCCGEEGRKGRKSETLLLDLCQVTDTQIFINTHKYPRLQLILG